MKALEQAMYGALTGRAQLVALLAANDAVYPDVIPSDEALPAVIYSPQGGSDAYTYGGRAFETLDYLVKGVVESFDPELANDISEQIDLALNDAHVSISGKVNMSCLRVGRISYPERDEATGKFYQHRGGVYRWLVQ